MRKLPDDYIKTLESYGTTEAEKIKTNLQLKAIEFNFSNALYALVSIRKAHQSADDIAYVIEGFTTCWMLLSGRIGE